VAPGISYGGQIYSTEVAFSHHHIPEDPPTVEALLRGCSWKPPVDLKRRPGDCRHTRKRPGQFPGFVLEAVQLQPRQAYYHCRRRRDRHVLDSCSVVCREVCKNDSTTTSRHMSSLGTMESLRVQFCSTLRHTTKCSVAVEWQSNKLIVDEHAEPQRRARTTASPHHMVLRV
jgi:hypothetical protein